MKFYKKLIYIALFIPFFLVVLSILKILLPNRSLQMTASQKDYWLCTLNMAWIIIYNSYLFWYFYCVYLVQILTYICCFPIAQVTRYIKPMCCFFIYLDPSEWVTYSHLITNFANYFLPFVKHSDDINYFFFFNKIAYILFGHQSPDYKFMLTCHFSKAW